jgi:hypothetical protein
VLAAARQGVATQRDLHTLGLAPPVGPAPRARARDAQRGRESTTVGKRRSLAHGEVGPYRPIDGSNTLVRALTAFGLYRDQARTSAVPQGPFMLGGQGSPSGISGIPSVTLRAARSGLPTVVGPHRAPVQRSLFTRGWIVEGVILRPPIGWCPAFAPEVAGSPVRGGPSTLGLARDALILD